MTKTEGEKAGVENHRLYFRAFNDKNNLAPPLESSEWYKKESVDLGNAPPFGGGRDTVGVVVRWRWPDASEGITNAELREVQERVDAGKWRAHYPARDLGRLCRRRCSQT